MREKQAKATADPYGMTNKRTGNGNGKGRSLRDDKQKDG
jgi:hypothetical protein